MGPPLWREEGLVFLGSRHIGCTVIQHECIHTQTTTMKGHFYCMDAIHALSPIAVSARSKAWTVFLRLNPAIVGSNPTRGMDVCVCLFCVCVVLCVGSGLATDWSPVQAVLLTVYRLRNWKAAEVHKGYRAIYRDTLCRAVPLILCRACSSNRWKMLTSGHGGCKFLLFIENTLHTQRTVILFPYDWAQFQPKYILKMCIIRSL
jgi:hypothetical protein